MEFHDVAEIKISTDDVNNLSNCLREGKCIKSWMRPIVGSNNLFWAFHVLKKGSCFQVALWISSSNHLMLTAKGKFNVDGAQPLQNIFDVELGKSNYVLITAAYDLRCFGPNGSLKMDVTFTGCKDPKFQHIQHPSPRFTIDDFVTRSNHNHSDARIVVGAHTLDIHRHVLCMISPVFHATFTHDTKESQTGTVDIKDFDFVTVKNVIDSCYGRECAAKSLADRLNMLRFADKYDIRAVSESLETLLNDGLTLESFCAITEYAWDLDKAELKLKCAKFYKDNVAEITFRPDFGNMNPTTIVDLIHLGASICSH
uniref:BTB domain-containing protein n=1 Tax=Panagrellus redivivus TaxID=6233 RepID=A0A7E4ZYQ5_PANRE